MPPLDAVPVAALLALLVTAYTHPSPRTEALAGLAAAGATLAAGDLGLAGVEGTVRRLGPVVLFLVTILAVADVCARAGLFTAAAARVRTAARSRPVRLFGGAFLMAAAVTSALSLDATVVLVTPVVVAAALVSGTSARPGAHACLRMANSASLLLPVSNLTNLLAMPQLHLTFAGFALLMAPVFAVVLAVEYVVLRVLFRADLAPHAAPDPPALTTPPRLRRVPVAIVAGMLVGFAVVSPFGVAPYWVSGAAAALLIAWSRRRGLGTVRDAVRAAHPAFALFVLCLGVVVAAISRGFLGDWVRDLLPGAASYGGLLLVAALATLLANLLTNLSATLLLVPLLAPLGQAAVLAALLGLNIGSGLTYTGSLANLLWRRSMVRLEAAPSLREFHRVSLVATPITLVAAVTVLALVLRVPA